MKPDSCLLLSCERLHLFTAMAKRAGSCQRSQKLIGSRLVLSAPLHGLLGMMWRDALGGSAPRLSSPPPRLGLFSPPRARGFWQQHSTTLAGTSPYPMGQQEGALGIERGGAMLGLTSGAPGDMAMGGWLLHKPCTRPWCPSSMSLCTL